MITLVLGAGASIPYGFPSGRGLVDAIGKLLRSDSSRTLLMQCSGAEAGALNRLQSGLGLGQLDSIDAFLETRKDDDSIVRIGKAAIAAALLPCEHEKSFDSRDNPKFGKKWYRYLWNQLHHSDREQFPAISMSVITLNYDRSLEEYLFRAVQNTYGLDPRATGQMLDRIPIAHLHGSLGRLPWEEQSTRVSYGIAPGEDMAQYVAHSAASIQLAHEPGQEDLVREANQLMTAATNVFFLGCSYHPQYMSRFRFTPTRGKYLGSCYGLTQKECSDRAAGYRPLQLNAREHGAFDALDFVRNVVSFRKRSRA